MMLKSAGRPRREGELVAMAFNQKEQRLLEKKYSTIGVEASYSLKLLDLNNRNVKVYFRQLRDKVSRLKSHLSVDEIRNMRQLEAEGKFHPIHPTVNLGSAMKIAATHRRLHSAHSHRHPPAPTTTPASTTTTSNTPNPTTPGSASSPARLLKRSNSVTGAFVDASEAPTIPDPSRRPQSASVALDRRPGAKEGMISLVSDGGTRSAEMGAFDSTRDNATATFVDTSRGSKAGGEGKEKRPESRGVRNSQDARSEISTLPDRGSPSSDPPHQSQTVGGSQSSQSKRSTVPDSSQASQAQRSTVPESQTSQAQRSTVSESQSSQAQRSALDNTQSSQERKSQVFDSQSSQAQQSPVIESGSLQAQRPVDTDSQSLQRQGTPVIESQSSQAQRSPVPSSLSSPTQKSPPIESQSSQAQSSPVTDPQSLQTQHTTITDLQTSQSRGSPVPDPQSSQQQGKSQSLPKLSSDQRGGSHKVTSSVTPTPFSSHSATEKSHKDADAKRPNDVFLTRPHSRYSAIDKNTSFLGLLQDEGVDELDQNLYEERRAELLEEEQLRAASLNKRKDRFLKDLDKYLRENPLPILRHRRCHSARKTTKKKGTAAAEELSEEAMLRRRRVEFDLCPTHLPEADYRERLQNLWKDMNMCRYLRVADEHLDLSAVNTLATDTLKLYKVLKQQNRKITHSAKPTAKDM